MILQRYIFGQLVVAFLFLFVVCMAVCLVGMTFQLFRSFEGMGLDLFGRMAPLAAGYVAPLVLLFSCCPATTLVYGRMAAENEIDAMRMTGLHANRYLAPAILFGVLLTLAAYALLEHATPAARDGRRRALRESALLLLKLPPPGKQVGIRLGPYRLSYMDYRNGRMEKIDLMRSSAEGPVEEYQAVSGYAIIEPDELPKIYLSKPSITRYSGDKEVRFTAENDVPIELKLGDLGGGEKRVEDMTIRELLEVWVATSNEEDVAEILTVYHTRYAQMTAPFLLVLTSVPVGVFVRKSSRLAGLGAALPSFLIYLIAFFVCKGMGEKGQLDPAFASYLPNAILVVMAAVLMGIVYRK